MRAVLVGETKLLGRPILSGVDVLTSSRTKVIVAFGESIIHGSRGSVGDSATHSSPSKDATRDNVNEWIRHSGERDGVVDFNQIVADPANPSRLRPDFDSGDHLHPNEAGQSATGDGVDLDLFVELAAAKEARCAMSCP